MHRPLQGAKKEASVLKKQLVFIQKARVYDPNFVFISLKDNR